ncbi:interferon gamma receptor 2 isoform X2 [Osmerus eperlanus]|uniref:interferon gamma receptor 2 isoform X2 n=1 Tax=Osmerus eperlanus TaxID=29151 RepID=UPI002E155CF1
MKLRLLYPSGLSLTVILMSISQVMSDELAPPQDVHVDSALRWRRGNEHLHHVKYTAMYLIEEWQEVPGCVQTELTFCNISSVLKLSDCVMLRVYALDGWRKSAAVQAYSYDNPCSPVFTLSPRPGSLTVYMRNNSLFYKYADNAGYLISYSRDGHAPQETVTLSSLIIEDLDVEERYCVEVQYTLYLQPYGYPSQPQCVVIPTSEKDRRNMVVGLSVPFVFLSAGVILWIAFVVVKNYEKMKRCLQPPVRMPPHLKEFLKRPCSLPPQTVSHREDCFDHISIISPQDDELEESSLPSQVLLSSENLGKAA